MVIMNKMPIHPQVYRFQNPGDARVTLRTICNFLPSPHRLCPFDCGRQWVRHQMEFVRLTRRDPFMIQMSQILLQLGEPATKPRQEGKRYHQTREQPIQEHPKAPTRAGSLTKIPTWPQPGEKLFIALDEDLLLHQSALHLNASCPLQDSQRHPHAVRHDHCHALLGPILAELDQVLDSQNAPKSVDPPTEGTCTSSRTRRRHIQLRSSPVCLS